MYEFGVRRKDWVGIINYAFFKSLRLDKITKGENVDGEEEKGIAHEHSNVKIISVSAFKTF